MIAIIPWILILAYPHHAIHHVELPGKTACYAAMDAIVKQKPWSATNGVVTPTMWCIPKGEPDYEKMGK